MWQLLLVLCAALLISAVVSHKLVSWMGLPKTTPTYRRIGPSEGPQVFLAGSSLLQFGITWSEVSQKLGQGIENWGVGGSSPVEWEVSQKLATNVNLSIVGVSVYDLNEQHFSDGRANVVSIVQTIKDLWQARSDWQFSKRLLSQYPLTYVRRIFPTAGLSDAVLVGLRKKGRECLKLSSAKDDRAIAAAVTQKPILQFGEDTERVSDWPKSKALRRTSLLRSHIQGMHSFDGPKSLALHRLMEQAQRQGGIVVVVLPVTSVYESEFLTPAITNNFEQHLAELKSLFTSIHFVRLDRVPALKSNDNFGDLVHLNIFGRRIATEAFLKELEPAFTVQ